MGNLLGKAPGALNDLLYHHSGCPARSPHRGAVVAGPRSATSGVSLWAHSCLRTSATLPVRLGVPHAHLGAVLGAATHAWDCALWALRDRPLANLSSWLHFLFQNEFQETLLLPRKLPAHVSWCSQDEWRLGVLESRSIPRTGDSATPAPRPTL